MDERDADLHPGEDLLIDPLTGVHPPADPDTVVNGRGRAERLPVRTGTGLVVHLDDIGALAELSTVRTSG
ncbi:hypothetical protein SAMN05660642_00956 [Geodermatophilus siccatus]|uniref:Uncharacterized protein n=1 Tax=Geodermatophilus siccatus TaxID=1137991 RepID=A0A1G9NAA6_9ACTN|nr:hypothetical protein [Geodermatophilus siccatus]SDL83404.1 hypothetical protein SAMN05660642_00956 [Geodermatophilus siccatus]